MATVERRPPATNGATPNWFDNADRVTTVATPASAGGQASQVTTSFYDSMGRVWRRVLPDGASVTNDYFLTGELKKTSGARTYPAAYTYDYAGRLATLSTW